MTRGALGERLAEGFLTEKGYRIAARNFRTRFGEIDLVAEKDGVLAFVEVKLRKNDRFGAACEAVGLVKQRKLILAAEEWLCAHPAGLQPRFDVVEVYLLEGTAVPSAIRHFENAFDAFDP